MKIHFIEATQGEEFNWGKFLLCQFEDEDWKYTSKLPLTSIQVLIARSLLEVRGWDHKDIIVFDLETAEGARFKPGHGLAKADLDKHKIWVCPMFEPFLEWLYQQDTTDITSLPEFIQLDTNIAAVAGYRRKDS